jgi:hypothetical protein
MMRTVAELAAYIGSRFPSVCGLPKNRCQTGDLYVIIGAPADPRSRAPCYADEAEAVTAARLAFDHYAKDKNGTLYWRRSMALQERPSQYDPQEPRWRVYLRLVITDEAIIWPDLAAYELSSLPDDLPERLREPRFMGAWTDSTGRIGYAI